MATPIMAADIPTKAPVLKAAPLPTVNWSGFYLGLGGGYGMYSLETSQSAAGVPITNPYDTGGQGFFGTAIAGFDWQFTNRIVAGVFADYDFAANIEGNQWDPVFITTEKLKLSSAWSVGGRAGWLVSPAVFSYFTAGYTQADFKAGTDTRLAFAPFPPLAGLGLEKNTYGGYFVGAGVEAMFAPGWFVRGEYRYSMYDTENVNTLVNGVPTGLTSHIEPKLQTVRAAVIKKFGWPGAPSYAVPAGVPVSSASWTGFYLAGGGGFGVFHNDTEQFLGGLLFGANQTYSGKGYFGTVAGGFDFAVTNRIVLGVFADYDMSDISGDQGNQLAFSIGEMKQDRAWAIGGRVGWLADTTTLYYATAGYAQAHFEGIAYGSAFVPPLFTGFSTSDNTYDGWFAGAGVERGLWGNFLLRTEYRYAKYGTETLPLSFNGGPTALADRNEIAVQTVRSTLAYKFNWTPAAVTARY
jgi:outer membrane immunogenic protein